MVITRGDIERHRMKFTYKMVITCEITALLSQMLATALRTGRVLYIVRDQMYDGRLTTNTACNCLLDTSYILCFGKYTFR